jgi:hypothetical protein
MIQGFHDPSKSNLGMLNDVTTRKRSIAIGSLLVLLGTLACQSEETKRCHATMTSAQEIVKNVDAKDLSSVEKSLAAVEGALDACTRAGRTAEKDELLRAKNELSGHAEYLKKKASNPARPKVSPEQLAAYEKSGDPNCPKGQAYRQEQSGKEIRCTGPQTIDMPWAKAEEYYKNRGYKLTPDGAALKAEYGAELFVFTYDTAQSASPPKCLAVYPPPGQAWQEAASRVTGIRPDKLDKAKPIATSRGNLALRVEETESKLVVSIGACG